MKYDEFAFFNQQLAAMLRDGVPLEGALRKLCAEMRAGELRSELERLESDLKNGAPLKTALEARKLPEFYSQMLLIGQQSNDLPAVLLMLADYYRQVDATWTRLKGLMVYPLIVLCAAFVLSGFLTLAFQHLLGTSAFEELGFKIAPSMMVSMWLPPVLIGMLLVLALLVLTVPALHRSLRWRLPAFKEAKLAQVASALGIMLRNGANLDDSLGLIQQMETNTPASKELAQWRYQLAEGRSKFSDMADSGRAFPPLFLWLVGNAGEDLAAGFQRAAEIYSARAIQRIEMMLYAALPFMMIALGVMICSQIFPVMQGFVRLLNGLVGT